MWIKDNITRTGKEVFYEAELIDEIKNYCEAIISVTNTDDSYNSGLVRASKDVLFLIKSYEGER